MDATHDDRPRARRISMRAATGVVSVAAAVAMAGSIVPALAAQTATSTQLPQVYQAKVVNRHVVLGPQSAPTLLTSTGALPAGKYMITAAVAAVISAQDQIVCAVSNVNGGNDGVFGTAGNPGTGSIYGTATMTDVIQVSKGQHLYLGCNSFNFGKGTYAGSAVLEAERVSLHS